MKRALPIRKLPRDLENPIDNIILDIVTFIQPLFKKLKLTPNIITTLSILSGIISTYFILNKNFILGGILYLLAYVLDCADGNYARTFNLCSKFGDYYDHFGDVFKFILVIYSLNKMKTIHTDKEAFNTIILFIMLFSYGSFIQLACQQIYYNNEYNIINTSDTLNFLYKLCPANKENVTKFLKVTRYVGNGTLMLFITMIILIYDKL
jgi:phosphatidylglycerophosphate synthase